MAFYVSCWIMSPRMCASWIVLWMYCKPRARCEEMTTQANWINSSAQQCYTKQQLNPLHSWTKEINTKHFSVFVCEPLLPVFLYSICAAIQSKNTVTWLLHILPHHKKYRHSNVSFWQSLKSHNLKAEPKSKLQELHYLHTHYCISTSSLEKISCDGPKS